jgi:hypothetical protein
VSGRAFRGERGHFAPQRIRGRRATGPLINTQAEQLDVEPVIDWGVWTTHFPWDPTESEGGWAPDSPAGP